MRFDILRYSGPCAPFNLPSDDSDLLPPPVTPYTLTNRFVVGGHRGWDFAGTVGTPVLSWDQGVVMRAMPCTKCTAAAPNFLSAGIQFNTPAFTAAFSDPAWGYGFGNNIIVRYPYSIIPVSGKQRFDNANLTNGYLYAIYGHLSAITVNVGQSVNRVQIGLRGNTGNSSGPHVHLELHGSMQNNLTDVFLAAIFDPKDFVRG